MFKVFLLVPVFAFAAEPVVLDCKSSIKNKEIPKYAESLKPLNGKDLVLTLMRDSIRIEGEEVDLTGEPLGQILTEEFRFPEDLGNNIGLKLTTASSLLGAKTVTLRFVAGEKSPKEYLFTWDLKCTNRNPGKVAEFVKLCVKKPEFKHPRLACKAMYEEETYGMPTAFTLDSDSMKIDYLDEDKPKTERFKFFPNENPGKTSRVKYLEYCYYGNVMKYPKYLVGSLWFAPGVVQNGLGIAVIQEQASDGGAYVQYRCVKD